MPSFTPGPWKIIDHDEDYIAITDDEQMYGICKIEEDASENRSAMKANARLIAAAPELLEALKETIAWMNWDEAGWEKDFVLKVRELIARAEGTSSKGNHE